MDITEIPGNVRQIIACSCCSYAAGPRGPLPPVDPENPNQERVMPAWKGRGRGQIRSVVIVPGVCGGYACEDCADGQCNGCYRCNTHCTCPPNTGRPAWILPTAEEIAALPEFTGPFESVSIPLEIVGGREFSPIPFINGWLDVD